jgi:hypothetical protein
LHIFCTHRGYVGELEAKSINFARAVDNTTKYHLFTHLDFSISYNSDRIIEVNVTSDPLQRVDLSTAVAHKVEGAQYPRSPDCFAHGLVHDCTGRRALRAAHSFDLSAPPMLASQFDFTYSVRWSATDIPFSDRMSRYAQYSFLPQSFEIHWLSIINSFVLVRTLEAVVYSPRPNALLLRKKVGVSIGVGT